MGQGLRTWCLSCCVFAATSIVLKSVSLRAAEPPRVEFTRRMVAHWANYADPAYLNFIDEAQPELVQLEFYGGHFWSLAHTPADHTFRRAGEEYRPNLETLENLGPCMGAG